MWLDIYIVTLERNGDLSNELIVGAEVLAAGRTLGLTGDEAIDLKAKQLISNFANHVDIVEIVGCREGNWLN